MIIYGKINHAYKEIIRGNINYKYLVFLQIIPTFLEITPLANLIH